MSCIPSVENKNHGNSPADLFSLESREVKIITGTVCGLDRLFVVSSGEEQHVRDLAGQVHILFTEALSAGDAAWAADEETGLDRFRELEARAHLLQRRYEEADAEL